MDLFIVLSLAINDKGSQTIPIQIHILAIPDAPFGIKSNSPNVCCTVIGQGGCVIFDGTLILRPLYDLLWSGDHSFGCVLKAIGLYARITFSPRLKNFLVGKWQYFHWREIVGDNRLDDSIYSFPVCVR